MTRQPSSFRAKIFSSVKLSSLRFMSEIGLRLVSTIVLTRLLAPEVYGVFAIVLLYMYLLEMFSDFGIRTLILTKEGDIDDEFLWTCWVVSILRGGVIFAISAMIAWVISLLQTQGVFADDSPYTAASLPMAIMALGGVTGLMGLQSPHRFVTERNMSFSMVTFADITRNALTLAATIGLAIWLQSIWALVLGSLVKTVVHVALSKWLFPGSRMRFHLNRDHLNILLARGKWIIGHSIMTAASGATDRLVLGLVMSSSTFGFYYIARQLVDLVPRFMSMINGQMALQMFAHLQKSSPGDFRRNYYRYRLFFDGLAGMTTGGLIVLSPLLVQIVFDDRYGGIAPIMQIIALSVAVVCPLLLRDAFNADRQFKQLSHLGLLSLVSLWVGLAVSVGLLGSMTVTLFVIALHRLPEALVVLAMGSRRGWVIMRREGFVFVFCGIGALLGWAVLGVWNMLT